MVPWYAVGALGAAYVIYDVRNANTPLKRAMKWAWPIIVFFFSILGLALYFATARAPGITKMTTEDDKKAAHDRYESAMWRRVNGAVIHCVAGDGVGIMTGMVIARASGMSFWQEFWFEYLVGFVVGWTIYQRQSMTMMTRSLPRQLAMAFRAEFFSMLTVMGGMGAIMTYVTPMVVTAQPKPLTPAFWGFGMLGLLVGFVLTIPMNWMMVKIGWKHGMGGKEGAKRHEVHGVPRKVALVVGVVVLGCAGLFLPEWLTQLRLKAPISNREAALTPSNASVGEALVAGLSASLDRAMTGLRSDGRTTAAMAMDDALRTAEVGAHSAPGGFYTALEQIRDARLSLQHGQPSSAFDHLANAAAVLRPPGNATTPLLDPYRYTDAMVIDQKGAIIGEVGDVSGESIELALGGWRNAWGFIDFSSERRARVAAQSLAFGPPNAIGERLVLLPTEG